jgi:hypothetical protein
MRFPGCARAGHDFAPRGLRFRVGGVPARQFVVAPHGVGEIREIHAVLAMEIGKIRAGRVIRRPQVRAENDEHGHHWDGGNADPCDRRMSECHPRPRRQAAMA